MTRPKPITDIHVGQHQVVVSFRVDKPSALAAILAYIRTRFPDIEDVDIAVREIGAGGERSEMEGEGP